MYASKSIIYVQFKLQVRYIRSIGNPSKAYMPYHFQSTSGFEYIQELPANFEYSYYSPTYDQHLGAIFPINQIESLNSRRCLEFNTTKKSAVTMKYYADKLPYRQTNYCYKPHGQKNLYEYDDVFEINQFFSIRGNTYMRRVSICLTSCKKLGKYPNCYFNYAIINL